MAAGFSLCGISHGLAQAHLPFNQLFDTVLNMPIAPVQSPPAAVGNLGSCAEILGRMTLEEKASLVAGVDDWYLRGFPHLGVPSIRVTDCGHGVTLCGSDASPATCFPTGIGMASTWNEALLEQAGRVLGRETRALGCSILLGPKINLHRHPLNGRSFETFAEDPLLAGYLGAAIIRGIQKEGVGSCVKAVAANNQQKDQEKVSSEVNEQTLREIYLRAFQIAVERGGPCAIMTSYNRLNGVYSSESEWLIKTVIKGEWDYKGFIVSDWRAVHSPAVYASGLDLEMPGPGKLLNQKAVLHALKEGLLTEEELDDKAGRILQAILTYGPKEDALGAEIHPLDTAESRATALAVAEESIVLLKNEENLLPLDKSRLKKILVIGPNASHARLGGGGSASVTPFYSVSPLQGIQEICGSDVEVSFMEGCSLIGTMEPIHSCFSHKNGSEDLQPGLSADFYNAADPDGVPATSWSVPQVDFSWGWASPGRGVQREQFAVRFSGWLTPPTTGKYRLGIYAQEGCVDLRLDGELLVEAWDRNRDDNFEEKYQTRYFSIEQEFTEGTPVFLDLTYGKRAARAGLRLEWEIPGISNTTQKITEAARAADAVIICAGLSNLFEGGAHDRENIDLPPAQESLIREVAAANPHTVVVLFNGGPLALPWESQVPAILEAWYPGQEGGRALARILFGFTNPSGRLPDTLAYKLEDHASVRNYPGDGITVSYEEGLFVGYRHFDAAGIEPHYPFGFGLGYTTFSHSPPTANRPDLSINGEIVISTTVQNTGTREGKEVVQLYIRPVQPRHSRPIMELRAFRKVDLAPGEKAEIHFSIRARDLEIFDPEMGCWTAAPGEYEILVGRHSRSLQGVTITVL